MTHLTLIGAREKVHNVDSQRARETADTAGCAKCAALFLAFSNRPVICVDANGEGAGVRLKRAKDCYAGRPKSAQLLTKS